MSQDFKNQNISNPAEVLSKITGQDKGLDAICAFTESQLVTNQHLKIIAAYTKDMKDYFNGKDGFAKDLALAIDKSNKEQTKDLRLQFFAIVGAIAVILGIVMKMVG